jgi:hypothetical protein
LATTIKNKRHFSLLQIHLTELIVITSQNMAGVVKVPVYPVLFYFAHENLGIDVQRRNPFHDTGIAAIYLGDGDDLEFALSAVRAYEEQRNARASIHYIAYFLPENEYLDMDRVDRMETLFNVESHQPTDIIFVSTNRSEVELIDHNTKIFMNNGSFLDPLNGMCLQRLRAFAGYASSTTPKTTRQTTPNVRRSKRAAE